METKQLAQLNLPGYSIDPGPIGPKYNPKDFTIGRLITDILPIVLYFAVFLALIMLLWASLRWIFSGGNKEAVAKARARITWAIVGLAITFIALFISNFVRDILAPRNATPTKITPPSSFHLQVPTISFDFIPTAYAQGTQCVGDACNLGSKYGFGWYTSAGQFISKLIPPVISVLGFALLLYFIWAGYLYMTSGGNKESIARAQAMITHAIIGLIVLLLSFIVLQFIIGALFGRTGIRFII